jgi:hypothetical protein
MKTSSGMLRCVVWYKLADVSEVLSASIIRAVLQSDFDDNADIDGGPRVVTALFACRRFGGDAASIKKTHIFM